MKKQIILYGFCVLLLMEVVFTPSFAQSDSVKVNCKKHVTGLFRQITGADWKATEESIGLRFIIDEKAKRLFEKS